MKKTVLILAAALLALAACDKEKVPQMADCYRVQGKAIQSATLTYAAGRTFDITLTWGKKGQLVGYKYVSEGEMISMAFSYMKDGVVVTHTMSDEVDSFSQQFDLLFAAGYVSQILTVMDDGYQVEYVFENGHLRSKLFPGASGPEIYTWNGDCLTQYSVPNGPTYYYTYGDQPAKGGISAFLYDYPSVDDYVGSYLNGFNGISKLPTKIEYQSSPDGVRVVKSTLTYETDADGYVTRMTEQPSGSVWTFSYE